MTASSSNYQSTPGLNVGIDVAKDTLEITLRPGNEHWSANNRLEAFPALIERLRQIAPERIILEATGGWEASLANHLAAAGLPVIVLMRTCSSSWNRARSGVSMINFSKAYRESDHLGDFARVLARVRDALE